MLVVALGTCHFLRTIWLSVSRKDNYIVTLKMNINLDNIVTISVNEDAGIEKLNIRYVRTNIPNTFKTHHERHNMKRISGNTTKEMEDASKFSDYSTSLACEISPTLTSPRPKQSYYFGQNPLSSVKQREEDKDSVLYKVI